MQVNQNLSLEINMQSISACLEVVATSVLRKYFFFASTVDSRWGFVRENMMFDCVQWELPELAN